MIAGEAIPTHHRRRVPGATPGPGGWAAILRYKEQKKELFGSEKHTTNNRMELRAAIEGLRALKEKVRGGGGDRFGVREERDHLLDPRMEAPRAG